MKAYLTTDALGNVFLNFLCPACKLFHGPRIARGSVGGPIWSWNRSLDAPSLQPGLSYWLECEGEKHRCHFIVSDGIVKFEKTSTHAFAGTDVPLPDITGVI